MPLGQCVWCLRYRLVELQTWKSPRSGEQLCGEVCNHCYYGMGAFDNCRTCRAKEKRNARLGVRGVHALERQDALSILARQFGRGGRGRRA